MLVPSFLRIRSDRNRSIGGRLAGPNRRRLLSNDWFDCRPGAVRRRPARVARLANAAPSWARDVTSSFGKIRYRWNPTVRCERYSCWPISRFEKPSAASCAICSSCGVRWSSASVDRLRLASPGGAQFLPGPLGPRREAQGIKPVASSSQRRTRLRHPALSAKPRSVGQLEPGPGQRPASQIGVEGGLEEALGLLVRRQLPPGRDAARCGATATASWSRPSRVPATIGRTSSTWPLRDRRLGQVGDRPAPPDRVERPDPTDR